MALQKIGLEFCIVRYMNRAGDEENITLTRCDNPEHDQLVWRRADLLSSALSRPAAVGELAASPTPLVVLVLLCSAATSESCRLARARIASHSSCKWLQRRHVP